MNPFHRLLIPTDGSENAKAASAQGLELALLLRAEVTALSVVDVGSMAYAALGPRMAPIYDYLKEGADAAVDQVHQDGERMGAEVKTIVLRGVPANEIIEASKDHDLIVMGTLGRTGLSHLLLGSVAEKVVRLAYCPVLVVRAHETHGNRQPLPGQHDRSLQQ